jgi:sugar phosphate isomerase/epimerase
MMDPVEFIYEYGDRIYHMHVKESVRNLNGRNGILVSHLPFGDYRRGWDFVAPGRGGVPSSASSARSIPSATKAAVDRMGRQRHES